MKKQINKERLEKSINIYSNQLKKGRNVYFMSKKEQTLAKSGKK